MLECTFLARRAFRAYCVPCVRTLFYPSSILLPSCLLCFLHFNHRALTLHISSRRITQGMFSSHLLPALLNSSYVAGFVFCSKSPSQLRTFASSYDTNFTISIMSTIPDHCTHGAMPRELLNFADIYARENLRAYYCQDCLRRNTQRSTTQLIFNNLCERLVSGDGTTLDPVLEEPKVAAVDGASAEPSVQQSSQDATPFVPQPVPGRLKLPGSGLRRRIKTHLRTPAQRRKEEQRVSEQRLVEAIRYSQGLRGRPGTEALIRRLLEVRSLPRSSVQRFV